MILNNEVERQLRIVGKAEDLNEAWVFVMNALDEVAEPKIKIEINPFWSSDDGFNATKYDIVVSGEPK